MNDPSPPDIPPTPFASPSWEPRFALDGRIDHLIAKGLELYLHCDDGLFRNETSTLRAFVAGPTRLVVSAGSGGGLFAGDPGGYFDANPLPEAARLIAHWLTHEAVYPERPWFDGGEAKGFQMYHVPWNQEPARFYGCLLVEPKWIEIHK